MPQYVPAYRLHKQSGQAIVTLTDGLGGRRDVLLGSHGTAESKSEYAAVIAQWFARGRRLPQASVGGLSVNELILAYWPSVEVYYRDADGKPTNEVNNIRQAMHRLRQLFGLTPAAEFDSMALEAVRSHMIQVGLCRSRINRDVARIKRLFKWGASRKLVPSRRSRASRPWKACAQAVRRRRSARRCSPSRKPSSRPRSLSSVARSPR